MSEPIKVGDLVQVVRPTRCCGSTEALGLVFKVEVIETAELWCGTCQHLHAQSVDVQLPDGWWVELERLKRIPPLSELDDVQKDEEITA